MERRITIVSVKNPSCLGNQPFLKSLMNHSKYVLLQHSGVEECLLKKLELSN